MAGLPVERATAPSQPGAPLLRPWPTRRPSPRQGAAGWGRPGSRAKRARGAARCVRVHFGARGARPSYAGTPAF
eukprot:4747701-Pyramimonas_sp.AAC.1